jgi:hypothetical protein
MPNQDNFKSNVVTDIEPRTLASRIISDETEDILFEYIPASFGYDAFDNIELHFYSFPANNLYLSTTIDAKDADVLKSHIVSFADDTFKNYIRIDFTKLFEKKNISLIPGDYKVTMNFFSDEIGSYDDKKLYVDVISDSRTEVQLAYFSTRDPELRLENINELREFVLPSFSRPTAIGVAEKIFRAGVRTTDISRDEVGLTYNNILQNIEVAEISQTETDTLGRVRRLGNTTEETLAQDIENILPVIYEKIREEIVIRGDRRIQEDEFKEFIEEAVNEEVKKLQATVDRRILIT